MDFFQQGVYAVVILPWTESPSVFALYPLRALFILLPSPAPLHYVIHLCHCRGKIHIDGWLANETHRLQWEMEILGKLLAGA